MKLRRTTPLVAAVVMAATTTVIGAGPASAATPELLCVAGTLACADASPLPLPVPVYGGISQTWLYNGPSHGPAQIQQAGTSLCLQLDAEAGYTVIEATCNGASYQSWQAVAFSGGWGFRSQWNKSQCLTYNEDKEYLDTVACNGAWYQAFNNI